jgi:transcriptional regulator with XRE-family HTH domain
MKEPLESVTEAGHRLGDYIRDQRRGSQISLRQLAALAGVSNPYLSQIERGLRKPSAEILQQIAKGLRISAEALYLQAGILEHREGGRAVVDAVLADEALTERQKQVLLEIYDSFRKDDAVAEPVAVDADDEVAAPAAAAPAAAKRRSTSTRKKSSPVGGSAASTTPTTPEEATA